MSPDGRKVLIFQEAHDRLILAESGDNRYGVRSGAGRTAS